MFSTEGGIFDGPTLVILSVTKAKDFGFLEEIPEGTDKVGIYFEDIKETRSEVKIKIRLSLNGKDFSVKSLVYNKKRLQAGEYIGIALAYLYKNSNRLIKDSENAVRYLQHVTYTGDKSYDSYLPYYLILREGLRKYQEFEIYEKNEVYCALEKQDSTADFYYRVYLDEKNSLRRAVLAKKGHERFPQDFRLARIYCRDLFSEQKYEECIQVLDRLLKGKDEPDDFMSYFQSVEILFDSYCFLEKFDKAEELIGKVNIKESDKNLFLGILHYRKGEFAEAEKVFLKALEADFSDGSNTNAIIYFLLSCYEKQKNLAKISGLLNDLPLSDLWTYPFEMDVPLFARKTLEECLTMDLNELDIAKIKGFLGVMYERQLPSLSPKEYREKLTREENILLKKSADFLSEALVFFPESGSINSAYSNIFYRRKLYDEALKLKFKALQGEADDSWPIEANLSKCSSEFIEAYPDFLEEQLGGSSSKKRRYYEVLFEADIASLWKQKKFSLISRMYWQFKDYFNFEELKGHYELMGSYFSFPLFEISYSLANDKEKEEAKFLYKKHIQILGKSSSVLNNLALIFEEEKNLKEAKRLIKEARLLVRGNDSIIEKNYQRIVLNGKKDSTEHRRKQAVKETKEIPVLSFDKATGIIHYGKMGCPVPFGTAEYYICDALFDATFGTRVEEGAILEKLYTFKEKDENPRTIYDAHRRINTKVKNGLGIHKLIQYGAASVWIRGEALKIG
jgi:hypothetical protein